MPKLPTLAVDDEVCVDVQPNAELLANVRLSQTLGHELSLADDVYVH